jgi:hypothetical protein
MRETAGSVAAPERCRTFRRAKSIKPNPAGRKSGVKRSCAIYFRFGFDFAFELADTISLSL